MTIHAEHPPGKIRVVLEITIPELEQVHLQENGLESTSPSYILHRLSDIARQIEEGQAPRVQVQGAGAD